MRRIAMQAIMTIALSCGAVAAQPVSAADNHRGWQTYRSAAYGFTIDFPSSMTFYPGQPVLTPQHSMIPICDDTTVACFEYNGDAFNHTSIQALGVAIDVLRDRKTRAACDDIEGWPMSSIEIHRRKFHYSQTGNAAAGSSENVDDYRTFYRRVCFEIDLATAQSDIGSAQYEEYGMLPIDRNALFRVQGEMHRMLQSLNFAGKVQDGWRWSVYHDSGCGGSFEYPSHASVREVVPFTVDGYESHGVTCEQAFDHDGRTYTVAVKTNLRDSEAANRWLVSSGMPGLDRVTVIRSGDRFTEYSNGTYTYLFVDSELFIFTVSQNGDKTIPSGHDKVLAHLLASFRFV
jgi:hypothetical protein